MKNFITKFVSLSIILCMFIGCLSLVSTDIEAYKTDFPTGLYSPGWGIFGDKFTVSNNQLKFTGLLRNENDATLITYDYPSKEVYLNYSLFASSADTSKSRLSGLITPYYLMNSTMSTLNMPYFKMTVTGYSGQLTLNCDYNTTNFGTFVMSLNTLYYVHMSCHQNIGNGTYYLEGKVWTASGSFESPDKMDVSYYLSYSVLPWKYVWFCSDNTNSADGSITGYIKDLSMNSLPEILPTNTISWSSSTNNPIQPQKCCEPSLIYNETNDRLDMWFTSGDTLGGTGGGEYNTMWYCYATNSPLYDDFSIPVRTNLVGNTGRITVNEYNGYYYLIGDSGNDHDLFMWYSSDKITWYLLNNGNPILTASEDERNPYYKTYNNGFTIVNDMAYVWLECGKFDNINMFSYAQMPTGIPSATTVFSLDDNRTEEPIFNNCNVNPVYIESYDSFLLFTAVMDRTTKMFVTVECYQVNRTADLNNTESYTRLHNLTIGTSLVTSASDASVVTINDITILQYFYGQPSISNIQQLYSTYNETQLYEMLVFGEIITPEPEPEPEPEPSNPSDYLKVGKVLIILAGAIPFIGFIIWALGKKD